MSMQFKIFNIPLGISSLGIVAICWSRMEPGPLHPSLALSPAVPYPCSAEIFLPVLLLNRIVLCSPHSRFSLQALKECVKLSRIRDHFICKAAGAVISCRS